MGLGGAGQGLLVSRGGGCWERAAGARGGQPTAGHHDFLITTALPVPTHLGQPTMAYVPPKCRLGAGPFPLTQPGRDRAPLLRVEEQLVRGGDGDGVLREQLPVVDAHRREVCRVHVCD